MTSQLDPFQIERHDSTTWPGTTLLDGLASVSSYRLEPQVVELLATVTSRLFGWQQPELPEDLCLLRPGGEPLLVTIAHEGDGYLVLEPTELEELRRELPDVAALLREET